MKLKLLNESIDIKNNKQRLLLTSNGFENPRIGRFFLNKIQIIPFNIKLIFYDTAAIDKESKDILEKCYEELFDLGIRKENILTITDMNTNIDLSIFDCLYMAGGDENYLINTINSTGFRYKLLNAIQKGLLYIGVSAGTCICSNYVKNNLGFISNVVDVHCKKDIAKTGIINYSDQINLSVNQAVWIEGDHKEVIE